MEPDETSKPETEDKPKAQTITRSMLAVSHAVDAGEKRYNLSQVRIDAEGRTMAANGHVLAITSHQRPEADSIPEIPGFQPYEGSPVPECGLSLAVVKRLKAATGIPKHRSRPILNHAVLGTAGGKPAVAHTDLDDPVVLPLKPLKDTDRFPNVDAVSPTGAPAATVGITAADFGIMQRILKDFGAERVKLDLFGPNNPFRITCSNNEGEDLRIIVQPYKLG